MSTPKISTEVVTKGAVDIAGSKSIFCKITGKRAPIAQAITIAKNIDIQTVNPRRIGDGNSVNIK